MFESLLSVWTILRKVRPCVVRDVDGTPVTAEQARRIIAERYTVTTEVRPRYNQRTRERKERQAETRLKKARQ